MDPGDIVLYRLAACPSYFETRKYYEILGIWLWVEGIEGSGRPQIDKFPISDLVMDFFGMAGRPLPIHTFFSFATEPDFGRSRLRDAVADSDAVVVASAEDTAVVPDALPVLAESGRFAVGGIAPNLMGAVEASGRGSGRKRGGGETREREYEY